MSDNDNSEYHAQQQSEKVNTKNVIDDLVKFKFLVDMTILLFFVQASCLNCLTICDFY